MKTVTKRETFLKYIQETFNAEKEEFYKYIILTYTRENFPCVIILLPKGYKSDSNFSFTTLDERALFIKAQKEKIKRNADRDNEELIKYEEKKEKFQTGQILYSSWGCEQTNIDFYIIIERKKDFVFLQEIGKDKIYHPLGDRGTVIPDKDFKIGEIFKKKLTKYASVKLTSFANCYLWDGSPKYWSSYA